MQNTMAAIRAQVGAAKTPALEHQPSFDGSAGLPGATAISGSRYRPSRTTSTGAGSASSSRSGVNDISTFGNSTSNLGHQQSPQKTGLGLERVSTIDLPGGAGASNSRMASSTYLPISSRSWEHDIEAVLKDIYAAVKATPIMQPLAYSQLAPPGMTSSSPYGNISRTPSRRSQVSSIAGGDRSASHKRNSIRGFLGAGSDPMRASSPTPSVGTSMSGVSARSSDLAKRCIC